MRQLASRPDPLSKEHPRIVVCGTRTFADKSLLYKKLDELTRNLNKPVVVTGGDKPHQKSVGRNKYLLAGADYYACMWAADRKLALKIFHADWAKHKEKAGPIRNSEMLEATIKERKPAFLIAFWNGTSKGTKDAIAKAKRLKYTVKIIRY